MSPRTFLSTLVPGIRTRPGRRNRAGPALFDLIAGEAVVLGVAHPAPVGEPGVPGEGFGPSDMPQFLAVEEAAEDEGDEEARRFTRGRRIVSAERGQHHDVRSDDGPGDAAIGALLPSRPRFRIVDR